MTLGMVHDRCELFTDGFSKLIQVVLGFVAIATLWIKRELEHPKRDFEVWVLDVSKQAMGVRAQSRHNILSVEMLIPNDRGSLFIC